MSIYEVIGAKIGKLVQEKNAAYGNSFGESFKILQVLYPQECNRNNKRMLATIRIIDKLFRIAHQKSYGEESPWQDIVGYSILGVANDMKDDNKENV
jgi:hypothetical protein